MVSMDFQPEGFDDLQDRLKQVAETKIGISMNQGLREIGKMMVPVLKNHTPTGVSRDLRNKTIFQIITGVEQRLEIRQGAKSGDFFYGRVVRGGRRPGARMPPPSALIPWVQMKMGVSPKQAPGVAFAVARKIGLRGIKPNPYHVRALRSASSTIQNLVNQMGQRITAYLAGG